MKEIHGTKTAFFVHVVLGGGLPFVTANQLKHCSEEREKKTKRWSALYIVSSFGITSRTRYRSVSGMFALLEI
jgi:hypothetical protein